MSGAGLNMAGDEVETPSGKGARDENFPVGSFLLPARLRPHVATFYAFARAMDDIADNPRLTPGDKIARLDGFDRELVAPAGRPGYAKAANMHASLAATGVADAHCRNLIRAFKQDAVKSRYRTWDELMDYCGLSAAPVGRYLIDLHGGARTDFHASDALCSALQIINHLQDCGEDYRRLDRVYLPREWLAEHGVRVGDLGRRRASPGLRRVIDRCLAETAGLVGEAGALARDIRNRRLRLEAAVILRLAAALARRLSRRDPLAERVELPRARALACLVHGLVGGLLAAR